MNNLRFRYAQGGALVEKKSGQDWIKVAVFKFGIDAIEYIRTGGRKRKKLRFSNIDGVTRVELNGWLGSWLKIADFEIEKDAKEYVDG
jgi:hypothetical protein